jgi:hypothetical protein
MQGSKPIEERAAKTLRNHLAAVPIEQEHRNPGNLLAIVAEEHQSLGTTAAARRAVLRSPRITGRLVMENLRITATAIAVVELHNRTIISFDTRRPDYIRVITADNVVEDNRRNRNQLESAEKRA